VANRIDTTITAQIRLQPNDPLYHRIADVGSLPFLLAGIALAIVFSIWRDLPRAIACAVGPVVAVLITERVGKPYVERHLTTLGGNSYPSGTVTAAAALVTVVTLAVPIIFRPLMAIGAIGVIGAVSVAVVGMGWHYPTDAIGGACVGVGSVLTLDAIVHIPRCWAAQRARASPAGETGTRMYASSHR